MRYYHIDCGKHLEACFFCRHHLLYKLNFNISGQWSHCAQSALKKWAPKWRTYVSVVQCEEAPSWYFLTISVTNDCFVVHDMDNMLKKTRVWYTICKSYIEREDKTQSGALEGMESL